MQAGIDFTARCMAAEALANGGSGGTSDYTQLTNKPSINNVELSGNKTSANLGLQAEITGNVTISSDNVDDTGATNLFVTSSEKSTWNGKQDVLAFDGIYDASTNKAATESTVYNEAANATLASGYTADSSETSITSATNINDAIEQLDYRTQTNKTNILLLEEMNGVKNLSPWSGGSISTSGYVVQNYPLVLPAGQYNVFFNTTATSSVGEVIFGDGSGRVGSAVFSHSTDRIVLAITLSRDSTTMTLTTSIGTTITNYMIITKAAYDAGFTDYQPYAMSNVELTEKVAEKASLNDIYGRGTAIPNNSDLNNYKTTGRYYADSSSVSATLSNTPITTSGFIMTVSDFYQSANNETGKKQVCEWQSGGTYVSKMRLYYYTSGGVGWQWSAWT